MLTQKSILIELPYFFGVAFVQQLNTQKSWHTFRQGSTTTTYRYVVLVPWILFKFSWNAYRLFGDSFHCDNLTL